MLISIFEIKVTTEFNFSNTVLKQSFVTIIICIQKVSQSLTLPMLVIFSL